MPFPTSTILLLCFFLACFVLSAHKPRPRVSVNSFQVPVSRHPAAPPLLATAAPAPLPPGGLSSTSAHLLGGSTRGSGDSPVPPSLEKADLQSAEGAALTFPCAFPIKSKRFGFRGSTLPTHVGGMWPWGSGLEGGLVGPRGNTSSI